ncbi:acyl-CoA reductase [Metabacillus herbersteinensis]|uniref:Acyl-CoA reductase n=1 Tax=Metabacillus herbersteinensis TaxID=283816 RepID=A0ABV6GJI6_9BACI
MNETAGYLPNIGEEEFTYKTLVFEGQKETIEVKVPLLTIEQMNKVVDRVKKASAERLKSFSVADIVKLIDQVIEQLLDRTNPYRQKAERMLPIITGYDEELIRLGLTSYLKSFRKQELQRFLVEDFSNPMVLDDFQPRVKRGFSKAVGPDLTVHIWSGNVPGLPLWSLISGLLVKSGNIGKVSSSEPLFAGWFAQLLTEIEPRLADCLAVVWWKGGDEERECSLFKQADVVVGYGGNASLQSLRKRIPISTRFLPFGHKISFGVISKASLDSRKALKTANQAAYDVVRYDQQGCYSPHVIYVQKGGNVSPREFAHYLAHELESFENRYPRRALSIEETTTLASWRQQAELATLTNANNAIVGEKSGAWTVFYEEKGGELLPSCLNRSIKVVAIEEFEDMIKTITSNRSYLQTVGVAAAPKELFHLADLLARAGVTRITGLGNMTSPESGWHHDGRFNLLDLVNMVDIEHTAEEYAESIAPYVD